MFILRLTIEIYIDMNGKSVMNLMVFTIVRLKTTKSYQIWSAFAQLIQTSTEILQSQNSTETFLEKNYENKK